MEKRSTFSPGSANGLEAALLPSVASARRRPSLRQRHAVYLRHPASSPPKSRCDRPVPPTSPRLSQRVRGIRQGAHRLALSMRRRGRRVSVRGGGVSRRARGRRLPLGWRRGEGARKRDSSASRVSRSASATSPRTTKAKAKAPRVRAPTRARRRARRGGTPRRWMDASRRGAPAEPRDRTWGTTTGRRTTAVAPPRRSMRKIALNDDADSARDRAEASSVRILSRMTRRISSSSSQMTFRRRSRGGERGIETE